MKGLTSRTVAGDFCQHMAPRARACSYSSSTNIHAPSASTKPSRSTENGREPFSGVAFHESVKIFIRMKPFTMPKAIGASAPPDRTMSARPRLDQAHRIAQCVGRRSTSGGDDLARPAQPEPYAQVTGKCSHDSGGHAEQAHVPVVLMEEQAVLLLGKFLRSTPRTDNHCETTALFERQGSGVDSSMFEGLARCRDGQGQYARNMLSFTLLYPCQLIESRHLARNLHRNFARIKMRDAPYSRHSCQAGISKCFPSQPVGTHGAHSRDHDSSQACTLPKP